MLGREVFLPLREPEPQGFTLPRLNHLILRDRRTITVPHGVRVAGGGVMSGRLVLKVRSVLGRYPRVFVCYPEATLFVEVNGSPLPGVVPVTEIVSVLSAADSEGRGQPLPISLDN